MLTMLNMLNMLIILIMLIMYIPLPQVLHSEPWLELRATTLLLLALAYAITIRL